MSCSVRWLTPVSRAISALVSRMVLRRCLMAWGSAQLAEGTGLVEQTRAQVGQHFQLEPE